MAVLRRVEVSLARISFGSTLRVLLVGFTCFWVPLALLSVVFVLAGCPVSTEDGEPLQGASAALVILLNAVIAPLLFAVCMGVPLWLGLRLFAYVRPWLGPLRVEAFIEEGDSLEGRVLSMETEVSSQTPPPRTTATPPHRPEPPPA